MTTIGAKWMRMYKPLAGLMARAAVITAVMAATMGITASAANAVEITKPRAVVELFTSQGCSSCPAADRALREFNADKEILGLSLHVDYWDRLGWTDTFASPDNTKRQWAYARAMSERQVYTPQAIVNGRVHLVGSRKHKILTKVAEFDGGDSGLTVPIRVASDDTSLAITVATSPHAQNATLYAFYFTPVREVDIKRGENTGKTIQYSNVVGQVDMIGMVGADDMTAEFSLAEIRRKGYEGCALILQASGQDGNPGPILGATVLSDL